MIDEWLHTGDVRGNVELDAFSFNGILVLTDDDRGTARRAPTLEQFGKPVGGSLLDNENPDRVEQTDSDGRGRATLRGCPILGCKDNS